jgi:putative phosphoesterase
MLEPEEKAYLQALPTEAYAQLGGAEFYLVHATPSDPQFKYMPGDPTDEDLARELVHIEADVVLMGHTHRPYVRRLDGMLVVNPGSVGQPKDGDPRASYAVWEDGEVRICRSAYPVEETIGQLEVLPLPKHVCARLSQVLRTGGRAE